MEVVPGTVVATQPIQWGDGVCGCCSDFGICCQTICCPTCTAANVIHKRDTGVPGFDCLSCVCYMGAMMFTTNRFMFCLNMSLRRELIQRYKIVDETGCKSLCLSSCCGPCSFCQVQREMGRHNDHAGGCCSSPPANEPSMSDKVCSVANSINDAIQRPPRQWGSGTCDSGPAECIDGLCCQCCLYGYMYNRLNQNTVVGPLEPQLNCTACCGSMLFPDGWAYANRREIMERYNIQGESHIKSLLLVLFCLPCSLLQQRREMGYSDEWPGGLCVKEAPARPAPPADSQATTKDAPKA